MSVKLSGLDFKAFLADKAIWPNDAFVEEETIKIDGAALELELWEDADFVKDSALVEISGGYIDYQDGNDVVDLEACVKRWLKKRDTIYLVIEVKKQDEVATRRECKDIGFKVIN